MSRLPTPRGFWFRHVDPAPARERVHRAVAALTRARCLQLLVHHGFGGLLAGLVMATVAVLASRLVSSPYPPWQLTGAVVVIALAVALLVGWLRRPDALEAAIRADLTLKLKQRLSTAWEFMTVHGDAELAERLAAQAVKAGLPERPGSVFPLQVNRWGRLAPLAAVALLLASVVDLNRMQAPLPREVDEKVVSEGQRLGAYGRAMQGRAKRDKLPRSERQAAQIERLGARMESGALSRDQALEQLRRAGESLDQERMQALAQASRTDGGSRRAGSGEGSPSASGLDPEAMLDRMRSGALDSADARSLAERLDDLEQWGIPRRDLEKALERHRAGADDALKEILERLAQLDRARKEGSELNSARDRVRRSRESLGETLAGTKRGRRQGAGIEWDDDEDENRGGNVAAKSGAERRLENGLARDARFAGSKGGSGVATDRQHSPVGPEPGKTGPVLKPEGRIGEGEGEVFTSQGRARPRVTRPRVESVQMRSEFASQVEGVLSNEQYPAHYKEFVRRYFLNLSRGALNSEQQPAGTRGAP